MSSGWISWCLSFCTELFPPSSILMWLFWTKFLSIHYCFFLWYIVKANRIAWGKQQDALLQKLQEMQGCSCLCCWDGYPWALTPSCRPDPPCAAWWIHTLQRPESHTEQCAGKTGWAQLSSVEIKSFQEIQWSHMISYSLIRISWL